MSEHFLHFKKAFHQSMPSMPQMKFPAFSKPMNPMNHFGSIQCSKWMKLVSTGIIVYSAYFYLKRTSKYNQIQHSFFSYFCRVKKLFSRSITNGLSREKETQKNITLNVKELPEHVKYDGGWFDELDELKRSSSSEEPGIFSKDGYGYSLLDPVRETTPRGEIIMYYDAETKSFHYYSNSKNIPYSTLDAVARKYVCLHKDATIYIDIRDEVQKGREKGLKQDEDNKSKLERNKNKSGTSGGGIGGKILSSAKKSLFATFKNYKTGRNATNPLFRGKKDVVVMKENINKFIYKGTLEQYDADLKYKKYCELIKPADSTTTDCADCADCPDSTDYKSVKQIVDHRVELGCKKKDLSYAEFKQKCNR